MQEGWRVELLVEAEAIRTITMEVYPCHPSSFALAHLQIDE